MNEHAAAAHEQWDELAAGYALHALEPGEETAFVDHLAGCERCAAALSGHELVAAQLGSLAHGDDVEDPPSWAALRTGIVGAAASTPPASLQERRARRRPPRLLGAAAAAVLLAGAGVVVWQAAQNNPSAASRAIAACERQAGCAIVRLHTPGSTSPAVVLVADGRATVVPLALKEPTADRTYVLWQLLRNGGSPTPVNQFRTTTGTVSAPLVAPYGDTSAFAVSLEPAGPMPTRPTKVVAVGNTPA